MALEKIIIQVGGQTDLKPTIDQLEKIGKVDDENAKSFKENSKKVDDSVKTTTGSVGNLGNALKNIATALPGGQIISQFSSMSASLSGATTAASGLSKGMNILKVAIASTGIGLLVIALGSLYAYFTKTEKGSEKLERAMAALGAAFGVVIGVVADFGETIMDAIQSPGKAVEKLGNLVKEFLIDRFKILIGGIKGIGSSLVLLFKGEFTQSMATAGKAILDINRAVNPLVMSVEILTKGYIALGISAAEAAKKAMAFTKVLQDIEDDEHNLEVLNDTRKNQVDLLLKKAKEHNKTLKERIGFLDEAAKIDTASIQDQIKLQDLKVKALQEENDLKVAAKEIDKGNMTDELREALKRQQALIGMSAETQQTIANRKALLLEQANNKAGKEEISFNERTQNIINDNIENSADEKIAIEEKTFDALADIRTQDEIDLERSIDEGVKKWDEGEKNKTKSTEEQAKIRQQLTQGGIQVAGQALQAALDVSLQNKEFEIAAEQKKNDAITQNQLDNIDKRLKAGKINEETAAALKASIQKQAAKKESDLKRKQWEAEKKANLTRVIIDTAVAIAKTFAQLGWPAGIAGAAVAAASGAIQLATISAQPTPAFKEGVIDFKGKGSMTSDDNLVRISNRESVIKARQTLKYKDELTAINNDNFPDLLYKKYILPQVIADKDLDETRRESMAHNIARAMVNNYTFDDRKMVDAIRSNKKIKIENLGDLRDRDEKRYSI